VLLPAIFDNIQLHTAVPHPKPKCLLMWCVTKYTTVNLDIISVSSHPTEYPLYVFNVSWDVSCFVTWRRKRIFLYDTKCIQSPRFSIGVRRCSVVIYCTGCTAHLRIRNSCTGPDHFGSTYSVVVICVPAVDSTQIAAILYLKQHKDILFWCGSFVDLYLKILCTLDC
jgi:hypothetical protein